VPTSRPEQTAALDAIGGILERGGDADDVLRQVVERLGRLYEYAAIEFVEGDRTQLGPEAGTAPPSPERLPVLYEGSPVGVLLVAATDAADRPFLEGIASLISPYVLVGWDTGGLPWPAA
jgi:hypothetical protein